MQNQPAVVDKVHVATAPQASPVRTTDRHAVAVYCGSRMGNRPIYAQVARQLGECLAKHDLTLVYGGASIGLMGQVADATLAAGGTVVGVIPEFMLAYEVAHTQLTELQIVPSMHVRKAQMAERASAFIALAGGLGTLEELTEMATWQQLDQHQKPIILINTEHYFAGLLMQLDRAVNDGLMSAQDRAHVQVCADVTEAMQLLHSCGIVAATPTNV